MMTGLLHLHNVLRYLIIIAAVMAIVKALSGLSGKKNYTKSDQNPGKFYMIFMDVQLLVGLLLYFMGDWGIKQIQSLGFGGAMKNVHARFFAVEHLLGMLIALVLVHIGYAATKKTNLSDQAKFRKSFWFYLISLLVILISIPWPFREVARGWFPGQI